MKYYINNKCLDIDKEELDSYFIGEGLEGECFKIGDDVLKIYKKFPSKNVISENDCKKLTEIETNRFILPNDLIYDEDGNYIGYTSDYVETKSEDKFYYAKDILDEFRLIEDDAKTLSDNNVDIYDLSLNNTIISNGIYLFDVGSYRVRNNDRFLRTFNREVVNSYELEEILFNIIGFTFKEKYILKKKLLIDDMFLTEVIDMFKLDEDERVKKYFKNMARR